MVKKNIDDQIEENGSPVCIYEVGYIMVPTIPEENLGAEVTILKDSLVEKQVVFISGEYPKLIKLAYEMQCSIANKKQKFLNGYFGWVKFECTTSQAKIIKESLDNNEKLIRYLMIRTIRENSIPAKHSYNKQDNLKRRFVPKEEKVIPINEEMLDKEIDALVV